MRRKKENKPVDNLVLVVVKYENGLSTFVVQYPANCGFPFRAVQHKIFMTTRYYIKIINVIYGVYERETPDYILTEEEINKYYNSKDR